MKIIWSNLGIIFFILFFIGCILGIIVIVQKLIIGELENILFLFVPILMLFIGAVSFLKKEKWRDIKDKYLLPMFIFVFGCCLVYLLFTYIKEGFLFLSLITFFFVIIIFGTLREYLAFYRVKRGESSSIAEFKGKDYTFMMQLPNGWQTQPHLKSEFFEFLKKKDNWGRVEELPLELKGKNFSEFVENEVKAYLDEIYGKEATKNEYKQIIYKEVKQICGKETIEVIIDLEEAVEYYTYIRHDPVYLLVLFKVAKEIYPRYQSDLRTSIESIMIK